MIDSAFPVPIRDVAPPDTMQGTDHLVTDPRLYSDFGTFTSENGDWETRTWRYGGDSIE